MPRFRCYDHGSDNTKSFTNTWLLFGHELSAKDFHSLCLATHDVFKEKEVNS